MSRQTLAEHSDSNLMDNRFTFHEVLYSKTFLKRNAIVPVFLFSVFTGFRFYKGLCFNKTKYKNMIA
jgi:hypothetical protein